MQKNKKNESMPDRVKAKKRLLYITEYYAGDFHESSKRFAVSPRFGLVPHATVIRSYSKRILL